MTDEEIIAWLDKHGVLGVETGWTADDIQIKNGIVSLPHISCYLGYKNLLEIPFKISYCGGEFDISSNPINTLENCPTEISGSFDFSNTNVKNLKGGPRRVNFRMTGNNVPLASLRGAPQSCLSFHVKPHFSINPYECRYLLLMNLAKQRPGQSIGIIEVKYKDDFFTQKINKILNDGRINGVMPSELIPGKIAELKELSDA